MSSLKKTVLTLGLILSAFAAVGTTEATACNPAYGGGYHAPAYAPVYHPTVVKTYVPVRPAYVPVQRTYHVNYYNHGSHCW